MKAPTSESSIKLCRRNAAPYRPCRRVETDAIPIHQQSFPLHRRVRVKPITTVELLDTDTIPIHRQRFPLTIPLSPQSKVDTNTPTDSGCVVREDGGAERPVRQEHKIRNLDATMGRYITSHRLPLESPPSGLYAADGDLYIHHYGNKKAQVWLREGDQWTGNISDGHHHPLLRDYRLFVADGIEPTWVTKKTRSTYKGRIRGNRKKDLLKVTPGGCVATGRSVHDMIGVWVGSDQRWSCSGTRSTTSGALQKRHGEWTLRYLHNEKRWRHTPGQGNNAQTLSSSIIVGPSAVENDLSLSVWDGGLKCYGTAPQIQTNVTG
ncbi:hypothetical protein EDD15DRAFT_2198473 [Pisolithus albus]|nr:hypothetical protein EDD15DRAFT_2198473 [Pisolithus albus]